MALAIPFLSCWALAATGPKYKADIPSSLHSPDKVQTELLGELDCFDGMPSDATAKKTFDFIDLSRAVDTFLIGMPAAFIYALLKGLKQAGALQGWFKKTWMPSDFELQP